MKKFLQKLSLYLLVPVVIMSVNYFADPANLFHEDYEQGIAHNLLNGFHVTNVYNHNERLLQKKIIQNNPVCPQAIALGSSRGMILNRSISQWPYFFNNAMSGSVLEDHLAIYELYEERGCGIKVVIMSLDPWLLNDNNGEERWKGLENEYETFLKKLYPAHSALPFSNLNQLETYRQLLSFSYFKNSVYFLSKGMGRKDAIITTSPVNTGLTRLIDGSVTWDANYREAPQSVVDRRAADMIAMGPIEFLENFDRLSPHYKTLLSDFVSYLQQRDVQVKFLLTPFHPLVYASFMQQKEYRNVAASETFFRGLAAQKGIEVFGSFDPAKSELNNTDFYDGFHCNVNALVKILNPGTSIKRKPGRKSLL